MRNVSWYPLVPPCAQVIADDTPVLQAVLMCDGERTELLEEESRLLAQLNREEGAAADTSADGKQLSDADAATRLEAVVKRLHEIDAYGAESRAASILSGLSFDTSMQVCTLFVCVCVLQGCVVQAIGEYAFVSFDAFHMMHPHNHPHSDGQQKRLAVGGVCVCHWHVHCLCSRICCCWMSQPITWTWKPACGSR